MGSRGIGAMETHLKRLTLINDAELALLNTGGIQDMEDLGFLKYVDIQALLIGSTTVTWRKVERVASYIYIGESVRTATTMADITASLVVAHPPPIVGTSTTRAHTADPSKGAPKLHVNALSEFDGHPINYED